MDNNFLIFKNSTILYLRLFITSILGLISSRLVIDRLGEADFGLYSVVGGIVMIMSLLNTVMISTTFRFIAFELGRKNYSAVNQVFNLSLTIHILLSFFVLVVSETIGVYYVQHYLNVDALKINDALFVLHLSTIATMFSIISVPFQGLITAHESFKSLAIIEILRSILLLLIAIGLINYIGNGIQLYSIGICIISFISLMSYMCVCQFKFKSNIRWHFSKRLKDYKELLRFSGWIFLGAAANVGQTSGTALIINSYFGTKMNTPFGIANQVFNIVSSFARNIGQATIPQITKSFSSGEYNRSITLTAHISKYTFFLMLFPTLPILLETDLILDIWLKKTPSNTAIFTQLMILNGLVSTLGSGLPAIVQASGNIKIFQIILSITSLISLPLSIFLFWLGLPPYSIIVSIILTSSINIALWQVLLKRILNFNVNYFFKTTYLKLFYVSILISPTFLLVHIFEPSNLRLIITTSVSIIWLCIAIYYVGLNNSERNLIKSYLLSFRKE